jgi:hypothetical protein
VLQAEQLIERLRIRIVSIRFASLFVAAAVLSESLFEPFEFFDEALAIGMMVMMG